MFWEIFLILIAIVVVAAFGVALIIRAFLTSSDYPHPRLAHWGFVPDLWLEARDLLRGASSMSGPRLSLFQSLSNEGNAAFVAFRTAIIAGIFTLAAAAIAGTFSLATKVLELKKPQEIDSKRFVSVSSSEILGAWTKSQAYTQELPRVREELVQNCSGTSAKVLPKVQSDVVKLILAAEVFGCEPADTKEDVSLCKNAIAALLNVAHCKVAIYE